MATFVAKNSGGVKNKPMIILKEFIFTRFSLKKRRQQLAGVRGFTMKQENNLRFSQNCNLQSLNLKTIRRFIKIITYSEALRVYRCSKAFSVMA